MVSIQITQLFSSFVLQSGRWTDSVIRMPDILYILRLCVPEVHSETELLPVLLAAWLPGRRICWSWRCPGRIHKVCSDRSRCTLLGRSAEVHWQPCSQKYLQLSSLTTNFWNTKHLNVSDVRHANPAVRSVFRLQNEWGKLRNYLDAKLTKYYLCSLISGSALMISK